MILFLVSLCLCTHLLDDVIYPYAELEPGWIIVNVGAPSPGIICTGAKRLTIVFSSRGYGHVNFYGDYEFHIRPATALRLHSDLWDMITVTTPSIVTIEATPSRVLFFYTLK